MNPASAPLRVEAPGDALLEAPVDTLDGAGKGLPTDVRLVPAAMVAWVLTWWAVASSAHVVALASAAAAVMAAVAALAWRLSTVRRGRDRALAAALAAAVGAVLMAGAGAQLVLRERDPVAEVAGRGGVAQVVATVSADPHLTRSSTPSMPRYVLELRVHRLTYRGHPHPSSATVLVLADRAWADLVVGSGLTAAGRLTAADPGERVTAWFQPTGAPTTRHPPTGLWAVAERLRAALHAACAGLAPGRAGLLPALAVGDTSMLPVLVQDRLRGSGLTHLTAVSGANLAILAGAVMMLGGRVGLPRLLRPLTVAAVLVVFVAAARPQPSVLRAAAMAAVTLAAFVLRRRGAALPALATAVLVMLATDPWQARSYGFALSVCATAGLVVLAPRWVRARPVWMPHWLAVCLAAPAAAQLACGPVLVLLQPEVSLAAVPANLVAEPAVAPATVLGLLACLLGQVWPSAAVAAAWCGSWATGWIAGVAAVFSAAPGRALPWSQGVGGALTLAALSAGLLMLPRGVQVVAAFAGHRSAAAPASGAGAPRPAGSRPRVVRRRAVRQPSPPRRPPARRGGRRAPAVAAGWVVALAAAVLLGWLSGPAVTASLLPATGPAWQVAMCDVGQGDALVLRSGPDQGVLVDAGPDPAPLRRCLRALGVRRLDLVLLTHDHLDHVGGLSAALELPVGSVVTGPLARPAANADQVRRLTAAAGVPQTALTSSWSGSRGHAGWRVSWWMDAPGAAGQDAGRDDQDAVNDSSVATLAILRSPGGSCAATVRVAALGDLETAGQHRLLTELGQGWAVAEAADASATGSAGSAGGASETGGAGADGGSLTTSGGPVDVLKVAHHGSALQVRDLYAALSGRVALIGVGAGNDYGHPAAAALNLLRSVHAAVLRTDQDGTVRLASCGGELLRVG